MTGEDDMGVDRLGGDTLEVNSDHAETTSSLGLVIGLVIGLPILVYGVRGAIVDSARTHPAELARWIVGAALAHDLVLVPLVLISGAVLRRIVTDDRTRKAIRAGFVVSASLTIVAWPFVRGYGRRASVPSLLPRNYAMGLLVYLCITWLLVLGVVALRKLKRGDGST